MFNLYTYEKKLLEYSNKEEEKYRKQFNLIVKKKRDEFCKNHEERMRNFIFSMCEKPIILKKNPSENQILNQTFNKKFVLSKFKTDRQRLEELISYQNKLNEYDRQRRNIEKKRNILKIKNNRDFLLIQPEMKFTSKSKLERIVDFINKEDIFKIDTSAPILEKIKKNNKLNKPKKIKEFYHLIDKSYLNDSDIKDAIKNFDSIEQNEKEINYTYRNYISWKYFNNITKNHKRKINKTLNNINTRKILKNVGKDDNKLGTKSDFDILKKDDIKTNFKSAEQYVEFLELRKNKNKRIVDLKFSTMRNNHKQNNNSEKLDAPSKAAILAMKIANRNKKNEVITYPKEKLEAKTSRNLEYLENSMIRKLPFIVDVISSEKNNKNYLNKKSYGLKDLNESLRSKKLMMNNIMENEISNSISKDIIKKHHSINLCGKIIKIPDEFDLPGEKNFSEITKDKNIKEKLGTLIRNIIEEKRKENDEKYKQFVKKYCRSIFGFKGKTGKNTSDEIKAENKLDYVAIDGKAYNKDDIKLITKIIFSRCNYYNKKRIYNE